MTAPAGPVAETVVLVVIDLAGGGTQKVVAGLARALRDDGTYVKIVTNKTPDKRWGDLHQTVDIIRLPGWLLPDGNTGQPTVARSLHWLLGAVRALRRVLKTVAPGTPVLAFLPVSNVLVALAQLGVNVPVVLSERNDVHRQPLPTRLRIARRLLYPLATVVTTNRPADLSALQIFAGRAPVHVVKNPPPTTAGRAFPSTSRCILIVGRLSAHKRHADVLLAFQILAQEFHDWTLRVLGDGPERLTLETLIRKLGLENRVEFAGWTSNVAQELTQGAILVHASGYEGTSNAILEAMATGLPVVASSTSTPYALSAENTARSSGLLVFPTGDVTMLASHLRILMQDAGLRDSLGEAARKTIPHLTADPIANWSTVIRAAKQERGTSYWRGPRE